MEGAHLRVLEARESRRMLRLDLSGGTRKQTPCGNTCILLCNNHQPSVNTRIQLCSIRNDFSQVQLREDIRAIFRNFSLLSEKIHSSPIALAIASRGARASSSSSMANGARSSGAHLKRRSHATLFKA